MNGTWAKATIWRAMCQFRTHERGKEQGAPGQETREIYMFTADPSGADAVETARRIVLGPTPEPWREFLILALNRAGDVEGLVLAQQSDLVRIPFEETAAAILAAGGHQQATIGELGRKLELERARTRELEAELATAKEGPPEGTLPVLYRAVKHVLDRAQTDPDLGYYVGPHMEAFERLCAAEAAYLKRPFEEVRAQRGKDLQPEHRRRAPEVVDLRKRVEELQQAVGQRQGAEVLS